MYNLPINMTQQFSNVASFTLGNSIMGFLGWLLPIVGFWILFESKDVEGWKAIIPIYNSYVAYKLFFKTSRFWMKFISAIIIVVAIVFFVIGLLKYENGGHNNKDLIMIFVPCIVMFVFLIVIVVISIQFDIAICRRYNMGSLFTLCLVLFFPIFIGILAYQVKIGKSVDIYEGNENGF